MASNRAHHQSTGVAPGWLSALNARDPSFAHSALSIPLHPTLSKYVEAIRSANLGWFFLNSLIITVILVAVAPTCSAAAAFVFATMRFRGREALFRIMLPAMAVPSIVLLVPQFKLMCTLT